MGVGEGALLLLRSSGSNPLGVFDSMRSAGSAIIAMLLSTLYCALQGKPLCFSVRSLWRAGEGACLPILLYGRMYVMLRHIPMSITRLTSFAYRYVQVDTWLAL